jgi:hypothetical protein
MPVQTGEFTTDAAIVAWGPWSETQSNPNTTGSFTANAVIKRTMGADWGTLVRSGGTPSAWFRLNETTGSYLDSGQTGLAFPPAAEVRGVTGYIDTAIRLTGSGNIESSNFQVFAGMSDANVASFETWIYLDSLVAARRGIFSGNATGALNVELNSTHHVRVSTLTVDLAISNATVTTGWNHIVWTRAGSGSTHKIYINGVESSLSTNASNSLGNPANFRSIGQYQDRGAKFTGIIDEIVIYGRTLSATEIATHASSLYLSFTAQAAISRTQPKSFTAAAWTVAAVQQRTGSVPAAAVVLGQRTNALTAAAWLSTSVAQTGSFTASAWIARTQSGSFSADAITTGGVVSGSITAKANIRANPSGSFTAAAIITRGGWFTAQAALFGHQTASFSASAWIYVPRTYVVPGDPGSGYVYANPTPIAKIVVGGVDITDDVMFETASFTSAVNGFPGACGFRVRDTLHSHAFVAGAETYLEIDGKRRWGGYITQVTRGFAFPYDDTTDESSVARFFTLTGVDYNILFAKRVLFDKANPTNVAFKSWPVDTAADTVIRYIFDHYTTLADDGCVYDSVTNAGTINPDKVASVGTVGFTFGDAMTEINRLINAVWYFDAFKNLHFTSADDRDNPIGLSDNPGANEVGFREAAFLADGTKLANDVFVWGAGTGSRRMAFAHVESGPSKNAHNLWQYAEFTSAMYHQWAVDERASSILNGNDQSLRGWKNNRDAWTLTIFDTRFSLGHKVLVTSDTFGLSDVYPIRKTTITFPTPWDVKTEMLLSHELDDPWNFYEFWFPRLSPPEWTIIDPPPFPCTNCADCPDLCAGCECGITDGFNRVVDGSWGTSDAGLVWEDTSPSDAGLHYSSVADGVGSVLVSTDGTGFHGVVSQELFTSALSGSFALSFQFMCPTVRPFITVNASDVYAGTQTIFGYGAGEVWLGWEGDVLGTGIPITLVDGTWYTVRLEREDGVEVRMKIWAAGDTEPDWTDTVAIPSVTPGGTGRFFLEVVDSDGNPGSSMEVRFDNLNIVGVDRCTENKFDTFERAVSGTWGVATPSGLAYSPITLLSGVTAGVDSGGGYVAMGQGQGAVIQNTNAGPWTSPTGFDARIRFRVPSVPASGYLSYYFGSGGTDNVALSVSSNAGDGFVDLGGSPTASVGKIDWSVGPWVLRWQYTPSGVSQVKVWPEASTEPADWLLQTTGSASFGSTLEISLDNNDDAAGNKTLRVLSIDFDYDGKPCYTGCVGIGIDTFENRTTTSGWGTASSNLVWQGAIGGGGVTAAVAGGEGHYGGGTSGTVADVRQYINSPSMAVFASDFDFVQRIRFDNGPTVISGDYLQYTIGYSDSDEMWWRLVGSADYAKIGWWHAVIVQFGANSSQIRIGVTTDIGDQDTTASTMAWSLISLSTGVDYDVRWSRVGTTVQARIWEAGTTEPATWDVTGTVTADFTLPITDFISLFTRRGTPAVAQGFSTAFIGDQTCTDTNPGGTGTVDVGVTDGTGTYNARPITPTTMFYLPVRFVAGSTRVWRDGVFQRPGIEYTEYPDLGEIVMDTAVQPDEVLTVDYVANGSL